MKLTCDLCGGELQMLAGGQQAQCVDCGLEYPKERLLEKIKKPVTDTIATEPAAPVAAPAQQMYKLFLKRKFNLSACAAKAVVYLDRQKCAILGARSEVFVPISRGDHEIVIQIAQATGIVAMKPVHFRVEDRDVYGLFYLKQSAFSAQWAFELKEHF